MVYGTADPLGSVDGWRRFAARLPHGELEVVDGGGHMPWYDDPGRVGARVARFLDGWTTSTRRRLSRTAAGARAAVVRQPTPGW